MIWLFVVAHLVEVFESASMRLDTYMNLCIVSAATHLYLSSYSSMIAQNILLLDRVLKGSEHRLDQVQVFIRYFQKTPFWLFVNLCCYTYTFVLYLYIWVISSHLIKFDAPEPFIRTSCVALCVMVNILNFFFLANWCYAVLKRIGTFLHCRSPLDCAEYAKAVNQILAGCRCNFVMDSAMQTRTR